MPWNLTITKTDFYKKVCLILSLQTDEYQMQQQLEPHLKYLLINKYGNKERFKKELVVRLARFLLMKNV